MKKMIFCILSVMLLFLVSCSVDDTLTPGQPDDQQALSHDLNARKVKGPVFTVEPSGDLTGIEDTDNLLDAFAEAKASGPGAVVQLVEGEYFITSIEIRDFYGSFFGAGMDKTIISSVLGFPCDLLDTDNVLTHLIKFINGDLAMYGMTLRIPDGIACETASAWYGYELMMMLVLGDYSDQYRPGNRFFKGVVSNIRFIGGNRGDNAGTFGDYNTLAALWVGADWFWPVPGNEYPLTRGDVTIKHCVFENFYGGGETACMGPEGKFTFENNTLKSLPNGYWLMYNYGANIYFVNNDFQNTSGIDLFIDDNDFAVLPYLDLTRRTIHYIAGNTFTPAPGAISLYLIDSRIVLHPENYLPQLITVKNNLFKFSGGNIGVMCMNSQDAQVQNNRFIGSGDAGIMVDGSEVLDWSTGESLPAAIAENVLVLGNNFSGMESSIAHVVLGENSMNCTVVGSGQGSSLDNGVDNSVSGLTPRIGPSISNNMKIGLMNGIKPFKK